MPPMGRQCNGVAYDANLRRAPRADLRRIEACKRTAMAAQATITRSDPPPRLARGYRADIALPRRRSIPEKGVVAAVRCGRKVF
jgi:hypothetical protein